MEIPVWIICLFVVFIIAVTCVWVQAGKKSLTLWETEAKGILFDSGYTKVPHPRVVESVTTYTLGRYDSRGRTTSSTIYMKTVKFSKNSENRETKFDNNTVMTALIHELAHIVNPLLNHSDPEFQQIIDKLAFSANKRSNYDPLIKMDKLYPRRKH